MPEVGSKATLLVTGDTATMTGDILDLETELRNKARRRYMAWINTTSSLTCDYGNPNFAMGMFKREERQQMEALKQGAFTRDKIMKNMELKLRYSNVPLDFLRF